MNFAHLHVHTEYSLLDGSSKIKEITKQAKKLGMNSLAITDHGVMYGVIDFYRAALANDIKPIIGCEVYVAPGSRFNKEKGDGEEKYIFPYQSSADIIFNTTLIYELAVLKKYAEPLLRAVPQSAGMAYTTAHRLLNILSYVKPLEDNVIPNNSILREFIGGSVFKDAL